MQEFKSSCDFQNEMNFDSGICVAITSNDNSVKITNTPVSTSSSSATIETSVTTSTTTPQITATKILSSTLTTNKNVINYYKRIEEFKKILYNLQRDKEFRDLQRKHLSQILERKPKKIIREICNVCFANLDREDPKTCTSCCNCKKYICRGQNCSIWIPNQAEWECRLCYLSNESRSRTSEWINRQQQQQQQNLLTNKFRHSMKNIRSGFSTPIHNYDGDYHNLFNSLEHYRSSPHLSSLDEREKIRRYIEETISQMLGGGSLDDVSVGQLYDNKEYLPQHEHYLRNDYAGVSNIKLRKLIEDIIEETHNLPPALTGTTPPPPITTNEQNNSNNRISLNRNENENLQYFDPKKYQELLATAVLNKIVNTCNCERKIEDNSSEILSTLSINLDKNDNTVTSKNNKSCSQSSSSIEPQSDSSLTDLANDLNHCHDISPCDSFTNICGDRLNQNFTDDESILNDYVKKHQIPLPALSISSESADEDFTSIATSNGQEGTWEDNWLFKRKKLGTDTSVGMLVPAPKEDIKALIGDKSADEMSDLSEAGSDFEDVNNNVDSLEPTNVRIHNQNVISGKDNIGLFDELIEQTSLISTSSLPENEPIFMETKNDFVLGNDGLSEIDNPKLSLSTGSVPSIKNEAVNVNVTSKISNDMKKTILHQTSVGNFEETIIDPPNDFTDDQKKTSNKAKQVNSLNSLPSDLTNADHCSSDSNSSDGSTSTVIDANEVLNQTVIEYFTRDEKQQTSLVPSKVIPISITNTTNQTNNTSAINDDLKIQNLESKCSNEDDYFNDSLPPLLPGSVAERERKKWLNAVDMPNNPYSPDALRRRLSDGPEKHIDIPNPILERASSEEKQISAADNTNEVRLQVDSKTEYEKYSRDYYINNDNENNNKRTTTQLNKNDNERILNEEKVSITATTTNNYSDNDKLSKNLTSDIYLAKIVHIEDYNKKINEQNNTEIESDNLLKRNNKKLTINNSNNNLLKLNRDSENENDIIKSPTTPTTPSLLNHQDDSLTPSEDSDTIRIYDLNKQETRIIKDDKTINDINKSTRPRILSFTAKLLSTNTTTSSSATIKKIVTPAALKFLQPKRKIFEPEQIMSDNEGTSSPVFEKREITPNTPNANKVPEKNVIEPEVAQALPSVKALAKAFLLTSAKCSTKHPERPRTRSTTSENGLNNIEKIKPSPDSYSPPYQQVTYSPIGPIVSQQQENNSNNNGTFKTEENDNICISSGINNDNDNNNDNELERPISPVLEPGKLKDNIAFFENLKKN